MSLKDGIVVSRAIKTAYYDAVEAVRNGEEDAPERLAKFIDEGMIRQDAYNKLISEYPIARAKRIAEEKRKADKKKKALICSVIFVVAVILLFVINALAHSGRTDANGGHRDNKNVSGLGYYHYHCGGNPPHLHSSGVCPYTHKNSSSNAQIVNPAPQKKTTNSNEYNRGYEEGYNKGKNNGYDEGYDVGYDKGYKAGYDKKQKEMEEKDDYNKKVVLSVGGAIALLWMLSKTMRHNK